MWTPAAVSHIGYGYTLIIWRGRRARLSGLDGGVVAAAPFGPGAVVDRGIAVAQQVEGEGQPRRGHARAAGCDHGLVKIDAGLFAAMTALDSEASQPRQRSYAS